MTEITQTRIVQRGDCAWSIAKRNLSVSGNKISNAEITKEMLRLANLNGCENVEDFNKKFFSTTGKEYVVNNQQDRSIQTPKQTEFQPANDTRTRTQEKPDSTSERAALLNRTPEQVHADKINNLPNDKARIIEHNKTSYQGKYYGIVDKKSCQLKIYDKLGNEIRSFTVGVGKNKGDNLQSYYLERAQHTKDAWRAEQGRYTTAGEFTLDDHTSAPMAYTGADGKARMMNLKGDNRGVRSGQLSIHMIYDPKTDLSQSHQSADYQKRKAAINSPGLEDNRMSYGCINLKEEDYDAMHTLLGEGDKIYVLPEEQGNKLQLEKQKDGSYKFEQIYHRNDSRSVPKEQASKINYDVRPERNPRYIAQQETKKNAVVSKQNQVSSAKVLPQKQEIHWYNPMTWFS